MICKCLLICYNAKEAGLAKTSFISREKLPWLVLGAGMVWEVLVCRVQQEKKGKALASQQLLHVESEGVYPGCCTSSALPGLAPCTLAQSLSVMLELWLLP